MRSSAKSCSDVVDDFARSGRSATLAVRSTRALLLRHIFRNKMLLKSLTLALGATSALARTQLTFNNLPDVLESTRDRVQHAVEGWASEGVRKFDEITQQDQTCTRTFPTYLQAGRTDAARPRCASFASQTS